MPFLARFFNSWLGKLLLGFLWEKLILLGQRSIEALRAYLATKKKEKNQAKNEEIRKDVENAKTPEEKQAAVDGAAGRWGKP